MSLYAGIDEAGRGCLAGPVVAAAVVLPENYNLHGLADSKTLSPKKRLSLEIAIRKQALCFGIGLCSARLVDEINILQATFLAMAKAVTKLSPFPEMLFIDGRHPIPEKTLQNLPNSPPGLCGRQKSVVHGDRIMPVISAASILAKTFRDRMMIAVDKHFPGYGFASHKGYGTAEHFEKLKKLGPSRIHRLTFRGVKQDLGLFQKHPELQE